MKFLQRFGIGAAALLLLACLPGCGRYPFNAQGKVNAAFTLPGEVLKARGVLEEQLGSGAKKRFEQEWERRLTLRALTCSKDYAPAWYASLDEVRSKLNDLTCFREQDESIGQWLVLLRVGLELAKPALRPVPAAAPRFIVSEDRLSGGAFAREAGVVALTGTAGALQVVDVGSGQLIRKDKINDNAKVRFSFNGRVVTTSEASQQMRFRNAESGEEIGQLSGVLNGILIWLDREQAIYSRQVNNRLRALLVNFRDGRETELPFSRVMAAYNVPDAPGQFILYTDKGMSKVEIVSRDGNTTATLVSEGKAAYNSWGRESPAQTADGRFLVAPAQAGLTVLDTESMSTKAVDLGPGSSVQMVVATEDADKVMLRLITPASATSSPYRDYLYTLSAGNLTPLESPASGDLTYVPALKALLVFNSDRITRYEAVAAGDPIGVDQFAADRRMAQIQRQMDSMQYPLPPESGTLSLSRPQPPAPPSAGSAPVLASLPGNARIEAIGVYQGIRSPRQRAGEVPAIPVRVHNTGRPLVLVLSSYESVTWQVQADAGVKIVAVLLSGYKSSTVQGTGDARIMSLGTHYAYEPTGTEYEKLSMAVLRTTGRRIHNMQGAYEGREFAIRSN
jgi:hypothetical protein